jgi:NTE family protein
MSGSALVLSGGGLLGVGWELGVLRGLQDAGVDIGHFQRVVGTSAGAISGAIVASGAPLEAVSPDPERDHRLAAIVQQMHPEALGPVFAVLEAGGEADQAGRARIGVIARGSQVPEALFIEVARLFVSDGPWPRCLVITAVDVDDGAFVAWGPEADVPLTHAVAASSSLPGIFPPITIAGRRYMDGAVRSPTSADLAAESDAVLIVAVPSRSERSDRQIAAETAAIRAGGGEIIEIRPDVESGQAFGPDPMDRSRNSLVFEAGLRQGLAAAGDVAVLMERSVG